MYKICKTQQSSERQRYMSDVLFKMMRRHKLDDISVCDLCQKAGVPRKAFYRYFDTLQDVIRYRFDHWKEDYVKFQLQNGLPSPDSLETVLEQFLLFWEDQSEFLEAIFYNNLLSGLVGQVITSTVDFVGNETEENFEEKVYFVVGGMISILICNRDSKTPCDIHRLAQKLSYMLTHALYEPPA